MMIIVVVHLHHARLHSPNVPDLPLQLEKAVVMR
jgi:hypothetical protein